MSKNITQRRPRNKPDKLLLKKIPGLLALCEFVLILAIVVLPSPRLAPDGNTPALPPENTPPLASAGTVETVEMAALTNTSSPVLLPPKEVIQVTVTAYSSTEDQTDQTPFRTANGRGVRDGIVAANFLPLGTRLRIPEVFGNKEFTVEDRMHERFDRRLDIWMPSREAAKAFGIRYLEVEIL